MSGERESQSQPTTFQYGDFLRELASEVGTNPSELSRRTDPALNLEADLLSTARMNLAERQSDYGELVERLNLEEQYESASVAMEWLTDPLETGESGIKGIDGKEYPMPSYEEVATAVAEQAETLNYKAGQGFTKLVLIPFGAPLDILTQRYGEALKAINSGRGLHDSNGTPLDLNGDQPVWRWENYNQADINGSLIYHPTSFGPNHGGSTKEESLNHAGGWQVMLVEDLPDLPAQREGETVGGRQQLEAGRSPNDYLSTLQQESEYRDEEGLTPEAWLALATQYLTETGQVIDDYLGTGKVSYLTGAYFPEDGNVPNADWRRDYRQARLFADHPDSVNQRIGARSAVRVI